MIWGGVKNSCVWVVTHRINLPIRSLGHSPDRGRSKNIFLFWLKRVTLLSFTLSQPRCAACSSEPTP